MSCQSYQGIILLSVAGHGTDLSQVLIQISKQCL